MKELKIGSEKQIKWADNIRRESLENLEDDHTSWEFELISTKEELNERINYLKNCTDSVMIIENRERWGFGSSELYNPRNGEDFMAEHFTLKHYETLLKSFQK